VCCVWWLLLSSAVTKQHNDMPAHMQRAGVAANPALASTAGCGSATGGRWGAAVPSCTQGDAPAAQWLRLIVALVLCCTSVLSLPQATCSNRCSAPLSIGQAWTQPVESWYVVSSLTHAYKDLLKNNGLCSCNHVVTPAADQDPGGTADTQQCTHGCTCMDGGRTLGQAKMAQAQPSSLCPTAGSTGSAASDTPQCTMRMYMHWHTTRTPRLAHTSLIDSLHHSASHPLTPGWWTRTPRRLMRTPQPPEDAPAALYQRSHNAPIAAQPHTHITYGSGSQDAPH
jgi:hypothetical protein